MEQSGILSKLRDKYFGDVFGHVVETKEATKIVLGFHNVLFPFLVLCSGILSAVITIIWEKLIKCFLFSRI